MKIHLEKLIELSKRFDCEDICNEVLANFLFPYWSASTKYSGKELHHYGEGGLLRHTLEVAELMVATAPILSALNQDSINQQLFLKKCIISAVFHDFGKMWDYRENTDKKEWESTRHAKEIGHIVRSGMEFERVALKYAMPPEDKHEILHAILSHHGSKEHGSPVSPKTKLAWLLHLCDTMSARYEDCERIDFNPKK